MVGLELQGQRRFHDVVSHEVQLARQPLVDGQLRLLTLEGGDGVGDKALELREFAEHVIVIIAQADP